ncbi:hypothetical protein T484DRAFT_3468869 [Baffinella frigidus]|nr:hypothetical protein T484DRAFT_3468869 [Cryptophyta sp. CCMP2293]
MQLRTLRRGGVHGVSEAGMHVADRVESHRGERGGAEPRYCHHHPRRTRREPSAPARNLKHAESETRNPKPETRNPKPEPETRNPKPETRNPKPETRNPNAGERSRARNQLTETLRTASTKPTPEKETTSIPEP